MANKSIKQFVRFKGPFSEKVKAEPPGADLAQSLAEKPRQNKNCLP